MEYCEVGDMSHFIKKKKAKGEVFTEDEILNWFIQIAISLEYIHGRKVIHRDIKTSNIFLTGNGTVKLGDFGISKVLENTNEAAMTVVGTPYYMSPEVCENKPYTFKSDVWALGCVLYELCTLEHAFGADNLLGLVYKIVKGNYESIPDHYSQDMKDLVGMILNKDDSKRPSVQEILLAPYLKSKMEEFISSGGKIGVTDLKIKTLPKIVTRELTEEERIEEAIKGITNPRERMQKKKEIKAQFEVEKLNLATRKSKENYESAKQRKYEQFYDSKDEKHLKQGLKGETPDEAIGGVNKKFDQFGIDDPKEQTDFSVNDRYEDTYALSNSMGTEISQLSDNAHSSKGKFSSYEHDTREIKSSGYYDFNDEARLVAEEEAKYPDDFEEPTRNQEELEDVLDNYRRIYSGDITLQGEKSLKKSAGDDLSIISEVSAENSNGNIKARTTLEKDMIVNYFGKDLYAEIYDYLKEAREKEVSDIVIERQMKYFVGNTNKEALSM
jgi:serine/threonine protein kinase